MPLPFGLVVKKGTNRFFDSGGPGQDGINLVGMSNGWEGIDLTGMQRELSEIPLQWFEAVDVTGIAVDPDIGWQVSTPA